MVTYCSAKNKFRAHVAAEFLNAKSRHENFMRPVNNNYSPVLKNSVAASISRLSVPSAPSGPENRFSAQEAVEIHPYPPAVQLFVKIKKIAFNGYSGAAAESRSYSYVRNGEIFPVLRRYYYLVAYTPFDGARTPSGIRRFIVGKPIVLPKR